MGDRNNIQNDDDYDDVLFDDSDSDNNEDEKLSEVSDIEQFVTPKKEKSKAKEVEYVSDNMDGGRIGDYLNAKDPFTHSQFIDSEQQRNENIIKKTEREQKIKQKIKQQLNDKKMIDNHLKHAVDKSQKKKMKKMRNKKSKKIKKLQKKLQNE